MAVTGLIMIGFLVMHMYGNLKVFMGAESFDHYAHWLKGDILYPLIPSGWFIWIFRAFMLAAIVLHMWSAYSLTMKARQAHGSRYVRATRKSQTYAARTMRWGGVLLAGFLVFHLLQFTARLVTTGFSATEPSPYVMVIASFKQWWVVAAYAIWMVAVCMHLRHGVWSAFTTLGANTSLKAQRVLNGCAWVIAILLYIGFMIMPVAVLTGVLH